MAVNIVPVEINPTNSVFPTKKMIGLGKDGKEFTDTLDFFKDSISDEWWTFYESMTIPKYFQDEIVYSFGIKSIYTCTGNDSELELYKQEYLRIGLERVFTYFNKSFDQETIDFFTTAKNAEGNIISKVSDYHLDSQPLSKLKFLIEVDARYLNALANNPEPSSFTNNRDEQGNLIIEDGFLNPTIDSDTDELVNDKNIFIVNLRSEAYERELEKTAYYMLQWHKDILASNLKLKGIDLERESKYLREASYLISSFVRSNFSTDGYSTGRNVSAATVATQNFSSEYDIRIAFAKDDVPDFPEFNIQWISVNFKDGRGDKLLDVGFKRLLNSHPLDGQATIQYVYNHQRILAGFDLGLELTAIEFLQNYHYPLTLDLFGNLPLNSQKDAPFGNQQYFGTPKFNLEQDPDRDYTKRKKTCGIEYPGEFSFNPDWIGLLRNFLSPVNYSIGFEVQFFSIGPPCPAPATSIATTKIKPYWKKEWNNFIKRIAKKDKNISKLSERWSDSVKDVSNYYTTDRFYNDAKLKAGQMAANLELTLRKAQDIIMGKFTLDKMLQAVCICVTQLADQLIEEHVPNSDKLKVPTSFSVGTSLGGGFDPMTVVQQLADEDSKFDLSEAFTGSGVLSDTFEFPDGVYDAQMEPLKLQKLCSFCIYLPDFMVRMPTFDLLKALLDLLLKIIEALLAYLIMQLLFSLMAWLLKCPDYSCETRPAGAPVNDYGSLDLPQFFPTAPDGSGDPLDLPILSDCPALLIPEDAFEGTDLQDIQNLLFERISTEFSSGQLMNIMEGYATDFSINTIQEIIMMESEFEQIRPFFEKGTRRKIEAFIDCIFENVDPAKIDEFGAPTQEVSYCPTIDNTPAFILANKCDNKEQVEKFLNREKFSQYSRIKGLINGFRENPNLLGDLVPEIFPSEDEDGEKKAGLFSDPKFKPAVATTMIEQLNPMIDGINSIGVRESPEVLRQLYVDGPPNNTMPSDKDNQIASTLQLSTAMVMLLSPLPALAFITAPFSDISEKKINSKYPIVGGPFAKPALESVSSLITFFTQSPKQGSNSTFSSVSIPNKNLRKFNSSLKMSSGIIVDEKIEIDQDNSTNLRVYFESVTDALASDDEPFSNNIIIDINSQYKNKNGDSASDSTTYSFRAPLDYDDDGDLEILNPVSDIGLETFNSLSYTENDYSPQGKVFAYLIETGLGEIFDNLDDTTKVEANKEFAGRFHMRAFTDMVRIFSFAAAESPFFRTYTYEELESGVGSDGMKTKSFKRFGRRDPYFDIMVGPGPMFKQKFKADDSNKRTDVYWKPTPAMNDTPMRRGVYNDGCEIEFIDRTKMKENIINNYDWADAQGGLDDPESLTNLNKAILDELIPEMIKFYCIDACIKAMPVNKVFKNYGVEAANEEAFTTLVVNNIINELSLSSLMPSGGGPSGTRSFPSQLIKYWDRKFTKYDKGDEEKPSFLIGKDRPADMQTALNYIVQEHLGGAMETASKLTQIKHLSDEDQAVDIAVEKVFTFSPDSEGGSVFTAPEFLTTPDSSSGLPVSKFSNFFNEDGDNLYSSLKNGNFIFESYIRIFLHDETIEWLKQYPKGSELVNSVHDTPISFYDLEQNSMSNFNLGEGLDFTTSSPVTQFMDFLYEKIVSGGSFTDSGLDFGKTGGLYAEDPVFSYIGEPNKAIFKDIKYYVRLSYAHTGAENSEEIFQQFYANGKNESSKTAIKKNKAFIYKESLEIGSTGDGRVVVLPLMEKEYNGSKRLKKTTNNKGAGTWNTTDIPSTESEFLNQQANYYIGNAIGEPNAFLGFMIKHFAAYLQYDYNRKVPNKVNLSDKEIVETIKEYKNFLMPKTDGYTQDTPFDKMPFYYTDFDIDNGEFKGPGDLSIPEYQEKFTAREAEIQAIKDGESSFGNNYLNIKGLKAMIFEPKFSKKKLIEDFAKLPEWKALFGYALPESIASNIVAVFAYLNIVKGLASENKYSYSKTKNLLTIFYIAAVSRSDFSGKSNQTDAMSNQDYSSFEETEEDEMQDPNDANPDSNKTPGSGDGAEPVCDD